MRDRIRFMLRRAQEMLWVRPLIACVLSVGAALLALAADQSGFVDRFPNITQESVEDLLSIMAASMLVIATFSVSSMISAYAAASNSATPRAFELVVADDVSQNALSSFIGSFIFSIVALIALLNDLYGIAGRFVLFVVTLVVFTVVIATFVRWVDRIARLGRTEATIGKAEAATVAALTRRRDLRRLGGKAVTQREPGAEPVHSARIGYVQQVDMNSLQAIAEREDCVIELIATPGVFTTPGRAVAFLRHTNGASESLVKEVESCLRIGKKQTFEDDPGFGLTVLSEIASRALSPGINDSGTAISVIDACVRAFCIWLDPRAEPRASCFDRVEVPDVSLAGLYENAFAALTRDGAGTVEVMVRLLEAYDSLLPLCDEEAARVTREYATTAAERAKAAISFAPERDRILALAEQLQP